MDDVTLLPCSRCGCDPVLDHGLKGHPFADGPRVECLGMLDMDTPCGMNALNPRVWNTRAALAAPATAQGDDFLRGWEAARDAAANYIDAKCERTCDYPDGCRCDIALELRALTPPAPWQPPPERLARWAYTFVMSERWRPGADRVEWTALRDETKRFWIDEAERFLTPPPAPEARDE
jgi:hypothetical protein